MIRDISFPGKVSPEIQVVSLEELNVNEHYTYNRANYYQFLWINTGNPTFEIDMHSVTLQPNSYLFIGKEMIYKFDAVNEHTGFLISFTDLFYSRTNEDMSFLQEAMLFNSKAGNHAVIPMLSHQMIIGYFLEIYNERSTPLREHLLHVILKLFLLYSERRLRIMMPLNFSEDPDREQVYAIAFKDLIKQHFIQHKEISFYADKIGISNKQLIHVSKKAFGQTPKDIIINKTIMEAKRMLVYSGLSVKEIAYTLGFKEPNNFSVFFQKFTGELPGSFKKSIRPVNAGG